MCLPARATHAHGQDKLERQQARSSGVEEAAGGGHQQRRRLHVQAWGVALVIALIVPGVESMKRSGSSSKQGGKQQLREPSARDQRLGQAPRAPGALWVALLPAAAVGCCSCPDDTSCMLMLHLPCLLLCLRICSEIAQLPLARCAAAVGGSVVSGATLAAALTYRVPRRCSSPEFRSSNARSHACCPVEGLCWWVGAAQLTRWLKRASGPACRRGTRRWA